MLLKSHPSNLVGHNHSLLKVGKGTHHLYLFPLLIFRENLLEYLLLVLFYKTVGSIYDIFRRPVILFQLENACLRESRFELQNIIDIGSTERIDALCIITHYTYAVMLSGQLFYDEVLCKIGILILINQDELEPVPVVFQYIGIIAQQDIGIEQQVVEIHAVSCLEPVLIKPVDLMQLRSFGKSVVLDNLTVLCVHPGGQQAVLCTRYLSMNRSGSVDLVVKLHLLDDESHQVGRIGSIEDGKIGSKPDPFGFASQHARKDGVERPHPKLPSLLLSHQLRNPRFHLAGSLVGKSEGQDIVWRESLLQQVSNLVC